MGPVGKLHPFRRRDAERIVLPAGRGIGPLHRVVDLFRDGQGLPAVRVCDCVSLIERPGFRAKIAVVPADCGRRVVYDGSGRAGAVC